MRARSRSKKEPAPPFSLSALFSIIEQGSALICTVTAPDALCNRSDMTQMTQMHTTRARARCRRKNGGETVPLACVRVRTLSGENYGLKTACTCVNIYEAVGSAPLGDLFFKADSQTFGKV